MCLTLRNKCVRYAQSEPNSLGAGRRGIRTPRGLDRSGSRGVVRAGTQPHAWGLLASSATASTAAAVDALGHD